MASSTSKDTEVDKKILGVTVEQYLLEISLSSKSSRVLIKHHPLTRGPLFSAPINNRYVYMLYKSRSCAYPVLDDDAGGLDDVDAGGLDEVDAGGLDKVDTRGLFEVDARGFDVVGAGGLDLDDADAYVDVAFIDLRDPDCELHKAPPITASHVYELTPIVLGSKLFAFYNYNSHSDHLCKVLDTASEPLVWSPMKNCPNLPLGYDDLPCYSVVSYAINNNDLFLSLGHGDDSLAVCYNDSTHTWSLLSDKPLPFYDQAKFVDGICYGFPKLDSSFDVDSLSSYKLSVDWGNSSPTVCCEQLVRYSLCIKYPLYHRSYLHSFFVSSSNTFTIMIATNQTFPHEKQQPHSLQVYVVELLDPREEHPSPPPPPPRHPCLRPFVPPLKYCMRYVRDDPQGSSRCLEHTSIPLHHHHLDEILGDF